MSYTLRVWFTGLVHFVENKDAVGACQICVVLPAAAGHHAKITKVKRETCCEKLRLRPGDSILDLKGKRAIFQLTRKDDARPAPRSALSQPFGVLQLADIAGEYVDEYEQIVGYDPPPPVTVQAQLLFEGGYTFGFDQELSVRRDWQLPGTLSGFPTTVAVADPVYIDFPDVDSATLLYSPLDGGTPESIDLPAGGNGMIEVLVTNRCSPRCFVVDDIEVELGDNRLTIYQLDKDFATHYQMLSPTTLAVLKKILPPSPSPRIPEATPEPKYPLPKSVLIDIYLAPYLCPWWLQNGHRIACPEEAADAERTLYQGFLRRLDGLFNYISRLRRRRSFDWLTFLVWGLNFLLTGTGTGSGSDCLHTMGAARFMDLDDFMPSPPPSVDGSFGSKLSRAIRGKPSPDEPAVGGDRGTSK